MSKTTKTKTVKAPKVASGAEVRAWAVKRGIVMGSRGRLAAEVIDAYNRAHRGAVKKVYAEPRHAEV